MRKKVVISLPGGSSYFSGLKRGFEYLGWEVNFFDFRKFSLKEKYLLVVAKDREKAILSLNQRLQTYLEENKPSLFFVMKGETIQHNTLERAKKLGIFTINWFPDYVNALEIAFKLSGYYDYFFHFDPLMVSQLKKKGRENVFYLPFSADILPANEKQPKQKKTLKVTFIGNYDSYREKYLESVSNLGLNIWGDKRWSVSALAKNYRGTLPFPKISDVLAKSEIGLNIQHQYPGDGAVLRVFEVMSSGTLLLSEYEQGLKRLFTLGKEMNVFKDKSDLKEKVTYYLSHAHKRESIAALGYLAIKSHHTYIHRLREILRTIG